MHGASSKLATAEENQGMREVELARGSEGTVGHAPETARVSTWEKLGAARELFVGAELKRTETWGLRRLEIGPAAWRLKRQLMGPKGWPVASLLVICFGGPTRLW